MMLQFYKMTVMLQTFIKAPLLRHLRVSCCCCIFSILRTNSVLLV